MTQDRALEILKTGRNVFLTGEPGAGKSHTIGLFKKWMNENRRIYQITASTGIAASHIEGTTIHSFLALGILKNMNAFEINKIAYNPYVQKRVRRVQTLIIDEISMVDGISLTDIDKILKTIHRNDLAFGGIQVVFVGDFFQLPPVVKGNDPLVFAFESEVWRKADLQVCYLTEQHRQSDSEFLQILSSMRNGTLLDSHKQRIIEARFEGRIPHTKLFTHNADVDTLNTTELNKLPGEMHSFRMNCFGIPALVEVLKKNCISPEILNLKKGAIVMFTRNNFDEGFVNGTLGEVIGFEDEGDPIVRMNDGGVVSPERVDWEFKDGESVKATINQYPLRLAWAITVHKSQGMSMDEASIDLRNAFEFGQGYVAISRVRTLQGLHIEGVNDKTFEMHPKVIEHDKIFKSLGV